VDLELRGQRLGGRLAEDRLQRRQHVDRFHSTPSSSG
jgi:hypothetical protein